MDYKKQQRKIVTENCAITRVCQAAFYRKLKEMDKDNLQ